MKSVFSTSMMKFSCIYLFILGFVKDLRKSMNIDNSCEDDEIICKWGRTDDIKRRTSEHEIAFEKIDNVNLQLKYFVYIDDTYCSKAESKLKNYYNDIDANFKYSNYEELIVVDKKLLDTHIKKKYNEIGTLYGGIVKEFNNHVKEYEYKLDIEKAKSETAQAKLETAQSDIKNSHKDVKYYKYKLKINNISDSDEE